VNRFAKNPLCKHSIVEDNQVEPKVFEQGCRVQDLYGKCSGSPAGKILPGAARLLHEAPILGHRFYLAGLMFLRLLAKTGSERIAQRELEGPRPARTEETARRAQRLIEAG